MGDKFRPKEKKGSIFVHISKESKMIRKTGGRVRVVRSWVTAGERKRGLMGDMVETFQRERKG